MTSSVQLYPRISENEATKINPFPQLIQTPSGLAILELQGTINLPSTNETSEGVNKEDVSIGRITFPDYHSDTQDPSSTAWMKRIHLYVGQHQRLTGEVKKLPKALAILRKRTSSDEDLDMSNSGAEATREALEIIEIVKYKLMFSSRPEPVGTSSG
ncbi:hypothetical protein F5Y15DRAFT_180750 [Xylariaceae sp. FL0016]|nr:hypothetical protein F5Y15DRAFT_180750 [Xylariaceae sp. FL0016]